MNALLGPPAGERSADGHDNVSPERIAQLARELAVGLERSLKQINAVNSQARLLALNARIEAARAGGATGAAFGVVARAMGELSGRTDRVASEMGEESVRSIADLERINRILSTNARGGRLSDLALTNIDLIDRNLYERSCDVRWWATDSSAIGALTDRTPEAFRHASQRMGVILNSYTVYFDLVLCDTQGTVVANGRPATYLSAGTNHAQAPWFRSAVESRSGTEFGFQEVHESSLVGGRRVLVYSCAVRAGGEEQGRVIGVLGIVFNWDGLAQTVVERVPLTDEERERSRVCITDGGGLILADTHGRQLKEVFSLPDRDALFRAKKNFVLVELDGKRRCIAHARAPGFETYSTGWHSLLIYTF
ncbi:MAG: methyl-accepting chemotaxis sensory transducer [Gemmataceae bacterium]|nr:methyl-accepting chemotaxis sensory transducer [Gemmataceae bacterium]